MLQYDTAFKVEIHRRRRVDPQLADSQFAQVVSVQRGWFSGQPEGYWAVCEGEDWEFVVCAVEYCEGMNLATAGEYCLEVALVEVGDGYGCPEAGVG